MASVYNAYDMPFLMKRKITEIDFLLQLNQDGEEKQVHYIKLEPNEGDSPPFWLKKAKQKLTTVP